MHVEFGLSVFQVIFQTVGAEWQFARFPKRDQGLPKGEGEGSGEQESAGLGGGDGIHLLVTVPLGQPFDRRTKRGRIGEQRGDVLEQDAGFWEVGNVPDERTEIHNGNLESSGSEDSLITKVTTFDMVVDLEGVATMDLTIRAATPADAETVVEFNAALAWESEGKRLHGPTLTAGVQSLLCDSTKGFYTLAERDGEVVGQTLITYEWSDWRNGWYWWIQSVYVRSDVRKKGVFRALFEHLKSKAMSDPEVIGLRLYVERENDRARRTYTALGMSEEPYYLHGMYPLPGRNEAFSTHETGTI